MIHVIAMLKAQPGQRHEIVARVQENRAAVLAEEGCIEYRPLVDLADSASGFGPDTLVIVEKWRDEQCLKNHATAPHMQRYAEKVKPYIQQRDVRILQDV